MAKIEVQTPELAMAGASLARLGFEFADARSAISSAQGQAGSFGDEPIGAAFSGMCSAALGAVGVYEQTVSALAVNVANASVGYVSTDEGVIPVKTLGPEGANP